MTWQSYLEPRSWSKVYPICSELDSVLFCVFIAEWNSINGCNLKLVVSILLEKAGLRVQWSCHNIKNKKIRKTTKKLLDFSVANKKKQPFGWLVVLAWDLFPNRYKLLIKKRHKYNFIAVGLEEKEHYQVSPLTQAQRVTWNVCPAWIVVRLKRELLQ